MHRVRLKKLGVASLFALAIIPLGAFSQENSTKAKLVDEYFQAMEMKQAWADMVNGIATKMPEQDREAFTLAMNQNVDLPRLERAAKESMSKHLTEEELTAFVDFVKQPAGKSALDKMKFYMADVTPVFQAEVKRAYEKYKAQANK